MKYILFFVILLAFYNNASCEEIAENIKTEQKIVDEEKDEDIEELLNDGAEKIDYEKIDPFSEYNKNILSFNMFLFRNTLLPMIFIVDSWTPKFVKSGYTNFINNLIEPRNWLIYTINGNKKNARKALKRFFINSTFGVLGLINVSERKWGDKSKRISIDCVFRKKNKSGRYIVSPITNQYFERTLASDMFDWALNPVFYFKLPFNYLLYTLDKMIALGKDKNLLYRNRKYDESIYKALLDSEIYKLSKVDLCD